jgi:DNA phosphorothioation-associated putative methyltransferase
VPGVHGGFILDRSIDMSDSGKRVLNRLYLHVSAVETLSGVSAQLVAEAIRHSGRTPNSDFNVVRIREDTEEVALLNYPGFFEDAFPGLTHSWRVHVPSGLVSFRDYSRSLNPPILHRKELLLASSHPGRPAFEARTRFAESLGLFDDPVRIGFRRQWEELVASKGYSIVEGEFTPVSNADLAAPEPLDFSSAATVERHRTALSRKFLSAPVQALLRHRVLEPGRSFFDYGCGRGDDLAGLLSLGYSGAGWDPHFRPDSPLVRSEVVNLGFVINVIEDPAERIAALHGAYALATGALSVAAILWSSSAPHARPYRDGVLTTRNTFQRFFSQGELQTFIESVLDEQAFPVGPGIYFVFRDRYLEQRFLSGRQMDPTRAPRLLATRERTRLEPSLRRQPRSELDATRGASLEKLWNACVEWGRLPDSDEYPESEGIVELFGSWKRALNRMLAANDPALLERAAAARMEELRLYFALQAFDRRRNRTIVDPRLKRDVRSFFGSLSTAEAEGLRLLKRSADPAEMKAACEAAAADGLGWLEGDHSLQLHTSMVRQLPPVLRAYVGCATSLYGDVSSADLIKLHIQSGKVSLMRFDDFEGSAIPLMVERVKIKLREQDLDYFEYGGQYPPAPLYFKSRYINEEFLGYAEQVEFDRQLAELSIVDQEGFGPSHAEFQDALRLRRRQISGLNLLPSADIPPLDQRCGSTFTYRQLIECGETWVRTKVDNVPQSAASFNALYELSVQVLDPVVEYFGGIKLTYGFAGQRLTRLISGRIAPALDQHAACERNARGEPICSRAGAAVDFLVEFENMREVTRWIASNCVFDRMYFYGDDRPLHVSVGPEFNRDVFEMVEKEGRRIPRKLSL